MSQLDRPLTPVMKADRAMSHLLRGVSPADLQTERDAVLSVTAEALQALADPIEAVLATGYRCALGSRSKLMANQAAFDVLVEPLPNES